jgi:hypothetical protein
MPLSILTVHTIRGSLTGDSFNIMLEFNDHLLESGNCRILGPSLNVGGKKLENCVINMNFSTKRELKEFERFVQTYEEDFNIDIVAKEFRDAAKIKDVRERDAALNALNKKYFSYIIGRPVSLIVG